MGQRLGRVWVALDAAGNGITVWNQGTICGNRLDRERGWGTFETIDEADEVARVGMDAAGNAIVVYGGFQSWARTFEPGVGWSSATRLQNLGGTALFGAHLFELAVNASGSAIYTSSRYLDKFQNRIESGRFSPEGGWRPPESIGNIGESDYGQTKVAINDAGDDMFIWGFNDDDPGRSLRFVSSDQSSGTVADWGTAPGLALDSAGHAMAVWQQHSSCVGCAYLISASRFTPGEGWSPSEPIQQDTAQYGRDPEVAFDGAGNAIAVWYAGEENGELDASIWANRYIVGVGWGTAELLASSVQRLGNWTSRPQIAVDSAGNAIVVWAQETSIWMTRYVVDEGWSVPEGTEIDGVASDLQLAGNAAGTAVAVWHQHTFDDAPTRTYSPWAMTFR